MANVQLNAVIWGEFSKYGSRNDYSRLPVPEQARLSVVCKYWNRIFNNPSLDLFFLEMIDNGPH
jgi:hypothetical protein